MGKTDPFDPAIAPIGLAAPALLARPASRPGCLPRKVLVVDDERDLADLAAALLCVSGIQAQVAYSAMAALQILECDCEIDAVFSDIMMPGVNGLELAETVRRLYPATLIVLATGFAAPGLSGIHEQTYPRVHKPYRIETVLELFRSERGSPVRAA